MRTAWFPATLAGVAYAFIPATRISAQSSTPAAFVSTRGNDTVSIEQYARAGNIITGVWIVRQNVQVHDYVLTLGTDGLPVRYEMKLTNPGRSSGPAALRSVTISYGRDTAIIVTVRDSAITQRVPMREAYPLLGNSYVGVELALVRLRSSHADSGIIVVNRPTGPSFAPSSFPVKYSGSDTARIAGALLARIDSEGRLLELNAGGVLTRRAPTIDVAKLVAGFVGADAPRVAAEAAADAARIEIALPASLLQRFVGEYRLDADRSISISHDDGKLFAAVYGRPPVRLFAETPSRFFMKALNGQVEFETDASGSVSALIFVQNGTRQRAGKSK